MGYISYLEDIEERIGTELNAIEVTAENPTVSLHDLRREVDLRITTCRDLLLELRERTSDPELRAAVQEIDRFDSHRAAQGRAAQLKRQNVALGRIANERTANVRKRDDLLTATGNENVALRGMLHERDVEIRQLKASLAEVQGRLQKVQAASERRRKQAEQLQKQIDDVEWQKYSGGKKRH